MSCNVMDQRKKPKFYQLKYDMLTKDRARTNDRSTSPNTWQLSFVDDASPKLIFGSLRIVARELEEEASWTLAGINNIKYRHLHLSAELRDSKENENIIKCTINYSMSDNNPISKLFLTFYTLSSSLSENFIFFRAFLVCWCRKKRSYKRNDFIHCSRR